LLPISSKIKRHRHKKDENVTRAKLPTQVTSKYWPKCPICKAPYLGNCSNCGYININHKKLMGFEDIPNRATAQSALDLIKKANESYDREKRMGL
jgi:hypothetical protein